MHENWKNAAHLVRLALVLLVGFLLFLAVRAAVVPPSFGKYGHFRAAALDDIRNQKPSYAGQATCAVCHDDVLQTKNKGSHRTVHCEACHGPQQAHADDPTTVKPGKPNAQSLCPQCHQEDAAKPTGFKQVDVKSHAQGMECAGCHQPHSPKL